MSRRPETPPSQGSSAHKPPPSDDPSPAMPDYRRQFPRKIRTAVGADAAARVFAAAYAANLTSNGHVQSMMHAHEAVEKFLTVLDQDCAAGQSV